LPQQKTSPRKTQIVFPGNGHGFLEKWGQVRKV
jgi:hypothetical protein